MMNCRINHVIAAADFNDLPDEMRATKRWLVWRLEDNPDRTKKPRKVPYYPCGRKRCGKLDIAADQARFGTFSAAVIALQTGRFSGLGFALGPDGSGYYWQGIDLDDMPNRPALQIIADDLPGYTEASPSGKGMHAIGYGKPFGPLGSNQTGIEAYSHGRYFTVTGEGSGIHAPACLADFVETRLKPMHGSRPATEVQDASQMLNERVPPQTVTELRSALLFMRADDREQWVRIGHALKTLGDTGRGLFMEWSATSLEKFNPKDAAEKWDSFTPVHTHWRAVFLAAQERGWVNPASREARIVDLSDYVEEVGGVLQPEQEIPMEGGPPPPVKADRRAYPPPFRGVMHETVMSALTLSSKPQPDLCTLSALAGMAASCNGAYRLPSGMRLNLFACGVAGTGDGKDHPRLIAVQLVRATNGKLIGKPASGPGLEDNISSRTGTLMALDEVAHFFAAINSGKAPPHLIELAGTLLQLFSASRHEYHTRVRAAVKGIIPPRTIFNPVVSLLGFATPEKLGEAMSVGNIEDGLLGRFLFAFGEEGVVPQRVSQTWALPEMVTNAATAMQEAIPEPTLPEILGNKEMDSIPILIDAEAERRLEALLVNFDQQRQNTQSAFAKALLTRSCEKCERVAGVLAVWDAPRTPVMTLEHVAWAEQLLCASDEALLRFSGEYMHGGETQANAKRVLKLIERAAAGDFKAQKRHEKGKFPKGAAPYSMVMRASKLAKRDFDDAIAHLADLSEVELVTAASQHPNGREEKIRCLLLKG
jgi:hypothetical protein